MRSFCVQVSSVDDDGGEGGGGGLVSSFAEPMARDAQKGCTKGWSRTRLSSTNDNGSNTVDSTRGII